MTEDELLYIKINYGVMSLQTIANNLNMPLCRVYKAIDQYKFKKNPALLWYAIYSKDRFKFMASSPECCRRLGINRNTLQRYAMPKNIEKIYSDSADSNYKTIAINLGYYPKDERSYYSTLTFLNKKLFGDEFAHENQ